MARDGAQQSLGGGAMLWQQRARETVQEPTLNKSLFTAAAVALALQGCATQPPPPQIARPDFNEGKAKSCTGSAIDLKGRASATATIAMTNDGWCSVQVSEADGHPFELGLVRQRAEHGSLIIQKVNDVTRIEYTADPRYVGSDRFEVALRPRDPKMPDQTVSVAVTVTMGAEMAPAPAPAPVKKTTPVKRKTTRKKR